MIFHAFGFIVVLDTIIDRKCTLHTYITALVGSSSTCTRGLASDQGNELLLLLLCGWWRML